MASWTEITAEAPELAALAQKVFDAHVHKTLATLRKHGSPRISGTEARFFEGDLWLGSMPGSRKAQDLLRDPRLALHSATVDSTMADGDAKLSGRGSRSLTPTLSRDLPAAWTSTRRARSTSSASTSPSLC